MTQDVPGDPLFIASAARTLQVLRTIGEATAPLGVSDIARSLRLTQSTTWRICYTLQKLGYARSDAQGRFSTGLQLLALGHAAVAGGKLEDVAGPILKSVMERFDIVCGIAACDGDEMVYLYRSNPSKVMLTLNLRVGSRVPILNTAMGWAYAAALPKEARAALFARLRRSDPERWNQFGEKLAAELRSFAKTGFVVTDETFHPGVVFAGVPFVHPATGDIYTFNGGGVAPMATAAKARNQIGPALLDAVRQITAGFRSP